MLLLAFLLMLPQKPVDGFQARTFKTMPYRLFVPPSYDKEHKYPLILWLHGAGSIGNDNLKQISGASLRGTHTWIAPQVQAKYPAFVLAPQSRSGAWTADFPTVLELLKSVEEEFSVDTARIYVAGQSMGGFGTWHFITTRPDLFAAAMPLCGGGDVTRASLIAHMPIWAFHGEADPTVPVSESRNMIAAIRAAGGNPRYTEYKGVGHEVWFKTFQEKELVDWLFAQHK
jgi:predicted peptidase